MSDDDDDCGGSEMDRLTISYLHSSIVFDDDASRSCWEGFAD